ncbi:sensor histidine kinase [Deinococcus hohokamensis]|uniref:histidine kinase n=1 Tax=Deinococcus hohokamensis TaxID=309883 RepID=A0ABV9I8L1_9DEIO
MSTDDVTKTHTSPHPSDAVFELRLAALEAENATLRAVQARYEAAPAALLVLNQAGRLQDINTQGCALLGQSAKGLLGRAFVRFISERSLRTYTHLLRQAASSSGAQSAEVELLRPAGAPLWVQITAKRHDTGELLLTLVDLTAHQQGQIVLLLERDALERQLNNYAQELRDLGEELDDVLQALSSEVHTAIQRGVGFLDLLHRDATEPSEAREQLFDKAQRALDQSSDLILALRGYARANRSRMRVREVDLNRVLKDVQKDLCGQMKGRTVQLISRPLPVVQGDSQALQLVLKELLSNALKFTCTRAEARIEVLVQETDDEVRLGVQDNGVGFNMRHKEQVFGMFQRLHPSGTFKGAGVGLAVVRRVCRRFGGRVWAEAQVDQGATFWIGWPKQPVVLH